MIGLFRDGGFIMYPLLAAALAALAYAGAAARHLRNPAGADARTGAAIDGVLFWGAFTVVLGLIGTLVGIVQAAQAIELAGGAAPAALVWAGIRIALTSTIFALLFFGVAALLWFVLRSWYVRSRRRGTAVA